MKHWTEVFGTTLTARDVVRAASQTGETVYSYLVRRYQELTRDDPAAACDPAPNTEAFAAWTNQVLAEGPPPRQVARARYRLLQAKRARLENHLRLGHSHAPTVTYWRRELQRITKELERLQTIMTQE